MDERLQRTERAFQEAPHDAEMALDLASQYLRAGRPATALSVCRAHTQGELYEAAGAALAEAMELEHRGGEEFGHPELAEELRLIPRGGYLEDGGQAYASLLQPGGTRAPLERVELPPYLIGRTPALGPVSYELAKETAAAFHVRLATAQEWKKAWRGGLFLDGDATCLDPNPSPDRVAPWGFEERPAGSVVVSLYGVAYELLDKEWVGDGEAFAVILDPANGRYRASNRSGLSSCLWRPALDVPPHL